MTSAMRRGFAKFTSTEESGKGQSPDKYRLLVTAGPSYDTKTHQTVPVNAQEAITIENEFVTAKVKVRVRGYRGLPTGSPSNNIYFDDPFHEKDQYSVAFSFVPKQDIPSVDTVWGNDFDHPIRDRLPPGFNTAFKIVKEFIDPGLACDAYADEPWLYGPSLSCWFAFRIGGKIGAGKDFPAPDDEEVMRDGADGSGEQVRQELNIPENNEKRRKFYLDAKNRKALTFEKGRLYQADFFNPYLDFGNLALKLPGFSLKVYKYIDNKSHCLRYVFKNRESGDMYLNINFNLLWGQGLEDALAKEQEQTQPAVSGRGTASSEEPDHHAAHVASGKVEPEGTSAEQPAAEHVRSAKPPAEHDQTMKSLAEHHQSTKPPAEHSQSTNPSAEDAEAPRQTQRASSVAEIERLLASTSTDDKRGTETSILDVD